MGYGDYSADAHKALLYGREDLPPQEVFKQSECHALMDPKGVRARESRDSAEHPESLAIAFALDVTGSMGDIPKALAQTELPKFMQILGQCMVKDPQVLFVAVGDAISDRASLQVGQFETTAELMDQWLTWCYLEGGGGPGIAESYELALYFLAEHTELDCWIKRQKRGYLFMTGDELPYPKVSRREVEGIIGEQVDGDIPTPAVVAALQQTWHPFFLIPDRARRDRCERTWRDLLGDQVICMESPDDTCYVAAGLVGLTEGVVPDLDALAKILIESGLEKKRAHAVIRALTPYASSKHKDGVPTPRMEDAPIPSGGGKSFWKRLFSR